MRLGMKALILQHEETTPPGSTTDWLLEKAIPYEICWPSKATSWPETEVFDLLFICGGSMNVDQEERHPWLKREKELIKKAIAEKKKVVGLCLGGQLIAEALGGRVGKHPQFEVGWHSVLLKNGESLKVFQWHGYSFSLPPGTELIATNSNCKYQGFTFAENVLAFQFHPESTESWVRQCSLSPNLPQVGFVQTPDEIRQGLEHLPSLRRWYFSQLDQLIEPHHSL